MKAMNVRYAMKNDETWLRTLGTFLLLLTGEELMLSKLRICSNEFAKSCPGMEWSYVELVMTSVSGQQPTKKWNSFWIRVRLLLTLRSFTQLLFPLFYLSFSLSLDSLALDSYSLPFGSSSFFLSFFPASGKRSWFCRFSWYKSTEEEKKGTKQVKNSVSLSLWLIEHSPFSSNLFGKLFTPRLDRVKRRENQKRRKRMMEQVQLMKQKQNGFARWNER